jgi:hypothetical protein
MDELLELYSQNHNVTFVARLGEGKDGFVFETEQRTAVKFLNDLQYYNRELRAYRALEAVKVDKVAGNFCPQLISSDDTFLAIEMTIVRPPFIVDFVSAYTDEEIQWLGFDDDVIAERELFWQERFGDRWPLVVNIRDEFHRLTGFTLLDLSHNNIRFE